MLCNIALRTLVMGSHCYEFTAKTRWMNPTLCIIAPRILVMDDHYCELATNTMDQLDDMYRDASDTCHRRGTCHR